MSGDLPWMPLHVADYLRDTQHLSAAENGAYLLLIMDYWTKGKLPTDERLLARIARLSREEWAESRDVLVGLFQPGWKHKRIEEELAKGKARYAQRAAAGKKGGTAKAAKRNPSNATAPLGSPLQQGSWQCSSNLHSTLSTGTEVVPVSPRDPILNPDDPFAAYSEPEIARLQIEFNAEDIPRALVELWDWSGRKGVTRIGERKAMIYATLQKRRGASELVEAKLNAPPIQASPELLASRLVNDGKRERGL